MASRISSANSRMASLRARRAWVQAGAAGFEDVVVVVMGNYPGQQIKPGSGQDFEQMLEAGVAFSVLDGTDGTTRCSSEFGQLLLGKPRGLTRLHHQRGGEGRHPLRRSDLELVVLHDVTEVRPDRSHFLSVPDPRHHEPPELASASSLVAGSGVVPDEVRTACEK
jgi:hypothetical protein